jgi:GcrA cell cycle regulator
MNSKSSFDWTDDRIESLRRYCAENRGYTEIGTILGCGKNSALGKARRLGITNGRDQRWGGAPRKNQPPREPRLRNTTRILAKLNGHDPGLTETHALPAELPADAIPVSQRRQLLELNGTLCHFPYGDPLEEGFFFCGGAAGSGLPYCKFHHRISHTGRG